MITFILIFGVLMRAIPMLGVLWLIWHVSRQPTATGLRIEREAGYRWTPSIPFANEACKRFPRRIRAYASGGRRREQVAPPTGD